MIHSNIAILNLFVFTVSPYLMGGVYNNTYLLVARVAKYLALLHSRVWYMVLLEQY